MKNVNDTHPSQIEDSFDLPEMKPMNETKSRQFLVTISILKRPHSIIKGSFF